jgi:hypothetical protein
MPIDAYSRTARLAPGLLLLLGPLVVAIGAGLSERPAAVTLTSAGGAMGLSLVLAEWVRRRGQRLQARLWAAWGGNPVVTALREDGLVARRRRNVLAAETGLPVNDPNHPDFEDAAANAVRRLISATRDVSQYPLVFAENKAYGFARNLLAIRPVGLSISALAVCAGIALTVASTQLGTISTPGSAFGAAAAVGALALWKFYPSEERVWAAASDYRDRLLEALDAGALSQSDVRR